jgi:hypothetical protein
VSRNYSGKHDISDAGGRDTGYHDYSVFPLPAPDIPVPAYRNRPDETEAVRPS